MRSTLAASLLALSAAGCSLDRPANPDAASPAPHDAGAAGDAAIDAGGRDAAGPDAAIVEVLVRLDHRPAPGTRVLQGGSGRSWLTDQESRAFVELDPQVAGERWIFASHPEARIGAAQLSTAAPGAVLIDLLRYDPADNPEYTFQDPGEPARIPSTAQCGHCHQSIDEDWSVSVHRGSASNPQLRDLYFGTARGYADAAACAQAGGRLEARGCVVAPAVAESAAGGGFGACADCHAPGIDGALGGRDLAEAAGLALEYGVHCDVCHRVDRVELDRPPGVAGRLVLTRPSEQGPAWLGAGGRLPLTFGPSHDVANPRMGSVQRDHFRGALFCAGCHQQEQPALVRGATVSPARWPGGQFPVQSTYQEWEASAYGGAVPCQECHMPPDPLVANGADLQRYANASVGLQGGFLRGPGAVRRHTWLGPRSPGGELLALAAALYVEKSVTGGVLTARVTVENAGAGHALPTGEPLRSVILQVEARCGGRLLPATGGDVVPDYGGYVALKRRGEDWATWPMGQVGDVLRVVRRPGGFRDYSGFGPFGDGRFGAADKGLPLELYAGSSTITAVQGDRVTVSPELPEGDRVYLVRGGALAGSPGFAFARVLVDAQGGREVPHFFAVDVASDNRLLPRQRATTTHLFAASCADPEVRATLLHRRYPYALAQARGWPESDQPMSEVRR